jgi:hypothetical protein
MIARVSGMCFLGSDPVAIASIRKSGPTDKLSRLRAASSQTSDAVWFCDATAAQNVLLSFAIPNKGCGTPA